MARRSLIYTGVDLSKTLGEQTKILTVSFVVLDVGDGLEHVIAAHVLSQIEDEFLLCIELHQCHVCSAGSDVKTLHCCCHEQFHALPVRRPNVSGRV